MLIYLFMHVYVYTCVYIYCISMNMYFSVCTMLSINICKMLYDIRVCNMLRRGELSQDAAAAASGDCIYLYYH